MFRILPGVVPEVLLTDLVTEHGDDDLLEDLLVLPARPELVLAPAVTVGGFSIHFFNTKKIRSTCNLSFWNKQKMC